MVQTTQPTVTGLLESACARCGCTNRTGSHACSRCHALLSVGGLGVGLLVWLPLYAIGGIGAGDVKLLAAFGAALGPSDTVRVALASAIVGGVFAVFVACRHRYMPRAWMNVRCALMHWRLNGFDRVEGLTLADAPGPRLAYAVPMLVGLGAILWLR